MRRAPGTGSVDQLPSGKWRARVRLDTGAQVSLGTSDTEAEARALLAADEALARVPDELRWMARRAKAGAL